MAEIVWTFEAERWLRDIHDFIAAENPAAAVATVLGIVDRAQLLLKFPEAGYRYETVSRSVRILLYGHYRITYLPQAEGSIHILGVFHGALDIDRYVL
jgi:plasmid stabilization system protein ParE